MDDDLRQALADGRRLAAGYALALPTTELRGAGGTLLGRRAGTSLEFQEYREYQPGDDLRHIDWNAYGRTDRLTVKLFREEITPHLELLIDGSRSMALADSGKGRATAVLAALLAVAAVQAGCSYRPWLCADTCRPLGRGDAPPEQWRELRFDHAGGLGDGLEPPPPWRRRGLRLLLSDLLTVDEPQRVVRRLARDAATLVVVQLLAADDVDPQPAGLQRLEDSESGESFELLVDAAAVERYRRSLERHQRLWRDACREAGARLVTVTLPSPASSAAHTEELIRPWLETLLRAEILRPL